MNFTKKELNFLKLYSFVSDTKSFLNDKVQIKVERDNALFSMFTNDVGIITCIKKCTDEAAFKSVYPIVQFNQMVESCNSDFEIEISEEHLCLGKDAEYKLNKADIELIQTDAILAEITNTAAIQSVELQDLDKLSVIKNYMGDSGFDAVVVNSGNFIAITKNTVVGVVNTSNNKNVKFIIPKIAVLILLQNKITTTLILEYPSFFTASINESVLIFPKRDEGYYIIPDVLDEQYQQLYNHKSKISVDKARLSTSLQRMSVISQGSPESIVSFIVNTNQLIIENKNSTYGQEKIVAEVDKELEGCKFTLLTKFLMLILSSLKGDVVTISASNMPEAACFKVEDEHRSGFFIIVLFEDL